jgi:hypothetical protein
MTLDQINLFLGACGRSDKVSMWQNVVSTLAGSRYDEKGLAKLQRQLEQK